MSDISLPFAPSRSLFRGVDDLAAMLALSLPGLVITLGFVASGILIV